MRWVKWIVAIVLLAAIIYICIAPDVDLPETVLRGILFAAFILELLHLVARRVAFSRVRDCVRWEFLRFLRDPVPIPRGSHVTLSLLC